MIDGCDSSSVQLCEPNDMPKRWLRQLVELVSECWEWHALALHMGIQCRKPEDKDDFWEVWVYPAVQEILGGRDDGETCWCGFNLDVARLLNEFATEEITLSTSMGREPPALVVEGKFRGREVLLHICLEPPEDVKATEIIDVSTPGR